jgi:hypothetical protein
MTAKRRLKGIKDNNFLTDENFMMLPLSLTSTNNLDVPIACDILFDRGKFTETHRGKENLTRRSLE